jgi:iron complex outermembrane recepter protein
MGREIIARGSGVTKRRLLKVMWAVLLLVCAQRGAASFAGSVGVNDYDIPHEAAEQGLIELARQTKTQKLSVLLRSQDVAHTTTHAVRGKYTSDEALSILLRDTGLTGAIGPTGIVSVSTEGEQNMAAKKPSGTWMGSLIGLIGAHLFSPASLAQEAPPAPPQDNATALQEVVVTGSRLAANFIAPTPVTSMSAAQLSAVSPSDIATALVQIPALNDSQLSAQPASASAATGTNGQSLLNLRGLGVNRTLVLLDGQRLGTTNVADSVDINMIPQSLLKSVDIVTGGASASYGSDAVAGVVNFILDTKYQGFKIDANAGTTTYGNGTNGNIEAAFGKALSNDLRFIAGVNFFKEGGIGLAPTGRGWHDDEYGAYPNPVAGAQPSTLVLPDARADNATYGGLITGVKGCATAACNALVGQQFGSGGVLEPFVQGADPNGVNGGYASGGQGATIGYGIAPSIERENALLHSEWDANSNLTFFAEGIFDRTKTSFAGQWPDISGTTQFTIFPNNAYLPTALQQFFAANPTATSFTMGRAMADLGPQTVETLEEVGRLSVGARGTINDRWSFDTSVADQYTVNDLDVYIQKERNLYAAANSVISPTTGQPVCASTLLGLDPGCVPINLFGPGPVSPGTVNYINGLNRGDTVFREASFEANLRGDLGDRFTLGAGPISVATGMAYRDDTADRHVDALSDTYISCTGVAGCPAALSGRYGAYYFYNPAPFYGSTSATEGYVEIGVPLLKDLPGVKSLSADMAGRLTDYNISGVEDTWKLGLQWTVLEGMMFRSTISQDIRAPDVLELFNPGSATIGANLFPSSSATPNFQVGGLNQTRGNTNLVPEIAHTDTAGFVLTPKWLDGVQTSLDYYKIDIAHAIEQLTSQGVINGCTAGIAAYCAEITENGVPLTTSAGVSATTTGIVVNLPTENVGTENLSGVDLESDYSLHELGGTITARLVANYLLTANLPTAITGCSHTDLIGAIGGCLGANGYPRWKGAVSGQYQNDRFGVFVQERLIASGRADPWDAPGTITQNAVPMIAYTDFNVNYTIGFANQGHVYLEVTNLFNRDPPETVTIARGTINPTSVDVYDILGRRFILGYRLSL